jgi:hypothetical protein
MIAFLHTSNVHIDRFQKLVRQFDTEIEIQHFVNEDLLKTALKESRLDENGFASMISKIELEQPKAIICTCSTYGKLCNNWQNVHRIDKPIVEYLVDNYSTIIIAFTVISTKKVSCQLIKEVAKSKNKQIEIIICDATDSWQYFENSDLEKYELSIANKVKSKSTEGEVVFLAQASMEGAKKHLDLLDIEIFTSPAFGVKHFLAND